MYSWAFGSEGINIFEAESWRPGDFKTQREADEWKHCQLCLALLGAPLDPELEDHMRKNPCRRQWLLDQAKKELLICTTGY